MIGRIGRIYANTAITSLKRLGKNIFMDQNFQSIMVYIRLFLLFRIH